MTTTTLTAATMGGVRVGAAGAARTAGVEAVQPAAGLPGREETRAQLAIPALAAAAGLPAAARAATTRPAAGLPRRSENTAQLAIPAPASAAGLPAGKEHAATPTAGPSAPTMGGLVCSGAESAQPTAGNFGGHSVTRPNAQAAALPVADVPAAPYAPFECWSGALVVFIAAQIQAVRGQLANPNRTFRQFADAEWVRKFGAYVLTRDYCFEYRGKPNDAVLAFRKVAAEMRISTDGKRLRDIVGHGPFRPVAARAIAGLRFERRAGASVGHWTAVVLHEGKWLNVDGDSVTPAGPLDTVCFWAYHTPATKVGGGAGGHSCVGTASEKKRHGYLDGRGGPHPAGGRRGRQGAGAGRPRGGRVSSRGLADGPGMARDARARPALARVGAAPAAVEDDADAA